MLYYRIIGLLFLVATTLTALGACPDTNIRAAVERGERATLEALATDLADCPQWVDSLGLVYHKLGVLAFMAGDLPKAIEDMRQAVHYREVAFEEEAQEELGRSYFNLGYFYELNGDYGQALSCFQASADIQKALGNRRLRRASTLRVAVMHLKAGDYDKAERLLKWIVAHTQDGEGLERAKAQLNLGLLYTEREASQQAIEQLAVALPYFETQGLAQDEAAALLNLANAHYHLAHHAEATRFGEEARSAYEGLQDVVHQSKASNLLGLAAMQEQRYQAAVEHLESALQLAQQAGSKEIIASTMDNLGEVALQQGRAVQAERWFRNAIHILKPGLSPNGQLRASERAYLSETPYKVDLFIYLNDLLEALLRQYEQSGQDEFLQSAEQWLNAGDYLIDQMRSAHSSANTKLFWREEALPFYESAVRICAHQPSNGAAFYFLEKSQSILLLEALTYSEALSAVPDSLRAQEQKLSRQLGRLQRRLQQAPSAEHAALLERTIATEQQLDALVERLSSSYPVYQKQSASAVVVSLPDFQREHLAGQDRALLHYLFGQQQVYLLYATAEEATLIELGDSDSLKREVEDFLGWFSTASRIERSPEAYKASAYTLFKKLIPPALALQAKELLVVPGGPLAYLPFDALLSAPHAGTDLSSAPYVVQDYLLNYAFSATLFDQLESRVALPVSKAYAMAPFAHQRTGPHPALKYSPKELQAIGASYPLQAFQDKAATRRAFLSCMQQANILHLSTHAYGAYEGQLPYIALADSSVFLTELYQWEIPAELVVLSACQSNVGRLAQGEGVLGLGRGFFYAGAKGVVASLWNLNDQSTSRLIGTFYASLAAGQPKGEALQTAKKQYLSDSGVAAFHKSPYYWAGLTYYGDSKVLKARSGGMRWLLLGLLGGAFLLGFFFWKGRR